MSSCIFAIVACIITLYAGVVSANTTYQRTSTGVVAINEDYPVVQIGGRDDQAPEQHRTIRSINSSTADQNGKFKRSTSVETELRRQIAELEARNALLERQNQDLLQEKDTMITEHTIKVATLLEEITRLRAEMEVILTELETLMSSQQSTTF